MAKSKAKPEAKPTPWGWIAGIGGVLLAAAGTVAYLLTRKPTPPKEGEIEGEGEGEEPEEPEEEEPSVTLTGVRTPQPETDEAPTEIGVMKV